VEGTDVRGQKIVIDVFPETGIFVCVVPKVPGEPLILLKLTVALPN
jgi:hypothetical protein